jgi:hypothetical protein
VNNLRECLGYSDESEGEGNAQGDDSDHFCPPTVLPSEHLTHKPRGVVDMVDGQSPITVRALGCTQ